jgi:hypothetical protein
LNYLVYNFATSFVWVIEVFFNILDYKGYFDCTLGEGESRLLQPMATDRVKKTTREALVLWMEVALAVIFFVDSTHVAINLSQKQIHKEAQGMTIDITVNLIAYSFLVYQQFAD